MGKLRALASLTNANLTLHATFEANTAWRAIKNLQELIFTIVLQQTFNFSRFLHQVLGTVNSLNGPQIKVNFLKPFVLPSPQYTAHHTWNM